MAELKASVTWQNDKAFLGVSPSGHDVQIDADKQKGASPMELILLGLGGCASYDVVAILQKSRQEITDVVCEMTAQRAETIPAVFTDIHLHFCGHRNKRETCASRKSHQTFGREILLSQPNAVARRRQCHSRF